jgi:hypothetical protein
VEVVEVEDVEVEEVEVEDVEVEVVEDVDVTVVKMVKIIGELLAALTSSVPSAVPGRFVMALL